MDKKILCAIVFVMSFFQFSVIASANDLNNDEVDLLKESEIIDVNELLSEQTIDSMNDDNNEYLDEYNSEELESEEVQVQLTKVRISKVNVDGELISGSKLQLIDSNGNILYEWISDGNVYEVMLSVGKYTLHEVEASEGYDLAEDKEFEIEVIIDQEIIGDSIENDHPCNHANNHTITYFVEIDSVSYEVYCINQGLATPDGIDYAGKILTPEELRDFTKQETNIDGEGVAISGTRINVNSITVSDYDVSDQTLTDQELYDKVLDIVYHRHLAENDERFSNLTETEIRFITEVALKNYLNARITTYETYRILTGNKVDHIRYNADGEIWQDGDGTKYIKLYNKYYNREYVYDITSPTGYIIDSGNGDSFGNFAKHWYESHGKIIVPEEYAKLFYYLISEENKHPEEMKLYMYSPLYLGEDPYQNLLGITGYIKDVKTEEKLVKISSNYSSEKTDVSVVKVWEDDNNDSGKRPMSVKVNLLANGELYDSIELSNQNNWSYVFENLSLYNGGKKILYTIDEIKVDDYLVEISGNVDSGFVITNTFEAVGNTGSLKEENNILGNTIKNPNTGDNIFELVVLLSSLSLLFYVIAIVIERKTYRIYL